MKIHVEPIGYVENSINTPIDSGWAKVESSIVLQEDLKPTLSGLNEFSHVVVVFWMHQAKPPSVLVRKPQNRNDMPEIGILSQRSKHRPNPIGVTAVQLVRINGCCIVVHGLDAINGTPVLDIKPYYPEYDGRPEAIVPEWVNRLMSNYF
ncbi:tRNA (N6-threonylcarbamoyladenosine(37)-N6)-methyltransferase TrmO [Chloroflexota bacterium]